MNTNLLESMSVFPYLGAKVSYNNSYWVSLYANLSRAQKRFGVAAKVLRQTGAHMKAQAMIYKSVVQTVLLYGCDRWVVTGKMMALLKVFHYKVACILEGLTERRAEDGEWEWLHVFTSLDLTGLWPMRGYIRMQMATIA